MLKKTKLSVRKQINKKKKKDAQLKAYEEKQVQKHKNKEVVNLLRICMDIYVQKINLLVALKLLYDRFLNSLRNALSNRIG